MTITDNIEFHRGKLCYSKEQRNINGTVQQVYKNAASSRVLPICL